MKWLLRGLLIGIVGIVALFVIIQAVPYGGDLTNPIVRAEPRWDSSDTRELVKRACFDCHSNETVWPWYSRVAPASWLVRRDVEKGRAKLNFSEWDLPQEETEEAAETIQEGEMPPWFYSLIQKKARLSSAEKEILVAGLTRTIGANGERESRREKRSSEENENGRGKPHRD